MTKLLYLLLVLSAVVRAEPARVSIERLYLRSARAAGYKFYPSMVAYRACQYQAFAPDGARMDLSNEAERYSLLFASALKVELKWSILEFLAVDSSHCRCRLNQQMTITRPGAATQLRTLSLDEWERGRAGWRLRSRRLLQQAYQDPS